MKETTESERILIEACVALKPHYFAKDNGQFGPLQALIAAREKVIRERMSPEMKERAYQAYKARRQGEEGWQALDLPSEAVQDWYEEFDQRYEGPNK